MNIALGYGCPGSCAVKDEGFEKQLTLGSWLLRFGEMRAYGTLTGYAGYETGDQDYCYHGPMTPGMRARSASATACGGTQDNVAVPYDGSYTTQDGVSLNITNGSTATLYNFTPYKSGNNSFYNIYSGWFGSPTSPCMNDTNATGITGEHLLADKLGINHTDNLSLVEPNNTGTACIEAHTFANNNYGAWAQHIASLSPAINPAGGKLLYADTNGDGVDELYQINYCGSSGMIEVHGFSADMQSWVSHIATNRPCISQADAEVIAADLNGDGKDEFYLVQYRNTGSGRVEIHGWTSNFQQWASHIATNYNGFDPTTAQVIAGDFDGSGHDSVYLVNYTNTGSGRVEIHGWTSNFQQWASHIATVAGGGLHVDGSTIGTSNPVADIISADTNGDGRDELYLILYKGTGSGRLEIHGMSANFQNWVSHVATASGSF